MGYLLARALPSLPSFPRSLSGNREAALRWKLVQPLLSNRMLCPDHLSPGLGDRDRPVPPAVGPLTSPSLCWSLDSAGGRVAQTTAAPNPSSFNCPQFPPPPST